MFGIRNIPPNYNYPQTLECSFNFFISIFSWELQYLVSSFFSAKKHQYANIQPLSSTPNTFLNFNFNRLFHVSVNRLKKWGVRFLCRECSETWFSVCVETPGPWSHEHGFWPQWHITNQDVSASDIIRNIWQSGIEVAFPYFLWRIVGEKRFECRKM